MFTLTKREQRIVIVIIIALLAAAFAQHYRNPRPHPDKQPPANSAAAPTPAEGEENTARDSADD